jgi:alpha-galactosidase
MIMAESFLSTHTFGDTMIRFPHDLASGRVGLELIPASALDKTIPRRTTLRGLPFIDAMPGNDPWPASVVEPLVQFKLVGEAYPGAFAQGHTLRNSGSVAQFKSVEQNVLTEPNRVVIVTKLSRADGCAVEHRLSHREGDLAFEISSSFTNGSGKPVMLEMLSSFSLGGLTPFAPDDAPGRLRVHRFRSAWSAEGRLETRSIEELHLERSWSGAGAFSERFGQIGSMPVRKWFPFVAVEDTQVGVVWGAQLAWAGSWQMEIFRQHDDVCLSGGLADREFGHWMKTILPGETFIAPPAVISCVQGSLDQLCDRLTAMQQRAVDLQPEVEQDLPIVFNEWCSTWGDPSHEKVAAIARRLRGSDVRYLVIDAGWYKPDGGSDASSLKREGDALVANPFSRTRDEASPPPADWGNAHGDWIPSRKLFPNGLEAVAKEIRAQGLIPGLWFETETVGETSTAFSLVDHLLKRDGLPITVRQRRFWDLNDPWAVNYLTEKVIDLLERCRFGYLKVDYNETVGLGCDNKDSVGEGLRRQVEGIYRLFEKIRERLPQLVIENCSSGGHRLEPSMLARTAMSSFSDAHELVEIPIIAANLHRLLLPRQSQIWAVLHRADSDQRLAYSLAATFLGRMCLSGEVAELNAGQWNLVQRAMKLHRRAAPIIKHGTSRRFGELGESWRHPRGWQAVVRTSADEQQALVVLHTFANAPKQMEISFANAQSWRVIDHLSAGALDEVRVSENRLRVGMSGDFEARVFLLGRR